MTHEYSGNWASDSVTEGRVSALGCFGFTQRQREFLVAVMVHSGCFLERQYCAFTGTVRGQNSREFIARLVTRGFRVPLHRERFVAGGCTTSTTSRGCSSCFSRKESRTTEIGSIEPP